MDERISPLPDAFATCPTDGKILEYYAGVFEAVFVLLHPFMETVSIATEQFAPLKYPSRSKIASRCKAQVSWGDVSSKVGLQSTLGRRHRASHKDSRPT